MKPTKTPAKRGALQAALAFGILSSFFFAFTFLLNRSMNLSGGFWMWSACLRYLFALPILALALRIRGRERIRAVLADIRRQPKPWFLWSTVGFGLFYLPMALASGFGASWLVAASWQLTIVAGVLLTPLFGKRIPVRNLLLSCVILVGVFLLQASNVAAVGGIGGLAALLPILFAAVCYPLGNRKMMQYCPEELDTMQRLFGMTLCSEPVWLATALVALAVRGVPAPGQLLQSLGVALFSSVVATTLFFHATDLVRANPKQLAVVEATQCGEVVFTLLGGILVLGDGLPSVSGLIGMVLIVAGMIANSLIAAR